MDMMRNLSIIILMWGYGLRISEVLGLKIKGYHMEDIRIIGKEGKLE